MCKRDTRQPRNKERNVSLFELIIPRTKGVFLLNTDVRHARWYRQTEGRTQRFLVVLFFQQNNLFTPETRKGFRAELGTIRTSTDREQTFMSVLLLPSKNVNGKEPLETTIPLQTQSTVWQDMNRPLYSGCEQDTVACWRT